MENDVVEVRRPGRPKGLPKTGGRPKGTPNRVTARVRAKLERFVNGHLADLERDWPALGAMGRAQLICQLLPFIVPKQTAVSVEAQVRAEYREIRLLLDEMPEEMTARIAGKMLELADRDGFPAISESFDEEMIQTT